MALESQQERCLCLAGTVALPAPVPQSGSVAFEEGGSSFGDTVSVSMVVTPTRTIKWTVRAADVVALCGDRSTEGEEPAWFLGDKAIEHLKSDGNSAKTGSVHVKEDSQVLVQIDLGLTAAEGVQTPLGIVHLGCCPHD